MPERTLEERADAILRTMDARAGASRLGRSMRRETDLDMLAMREASRVIRELLEVRAGVVAEGPEWETERVEEARIHYRYGVNSGTLAARNTPESIAAAVEVHERRTMGPIGVERIEVRTKVTRTSPWGPVERGGAEADA